MLSSSYEDMADTQSTDCEPIFTEKINFKEIRLAEVVGKGTFGVVRRGIWRNVEVAVKLIETDQERKAFQIELRQLSRVSHPNIVKLYGATIQPVALVMEYAEGGSLYNVLHSIPCVPYTLSHAMSWVLQCARGVSYLHAMQPKALIHRDLKPPNLLLINGGTILKICDFGTACDIHTHMTNNKGSAAWMAPEVFESWNYSEKCDVFSWGIILWEVLARKKPFDEIGGPAFRIMWAVHSGVRPPLLRNCPKVIENLMIKCWSKNPDERPSMAEVEKRVESIFKYCDEHANEPIVYTVSHGNVHPSHESISSTNYSIDQHMQTQLDAPQQIVTEPPVLNISTTNIMNSDYVLQSRINPAFSVPPNLSGLINSTYNASHILNNSDFTQQKLPRRSSEVNHQVVESNASSSGSSFHKGHKRSSSSGTPVTITGVTPQSLNKSRSFIGINDDVNASENLPDGTHLRTFELSHLVPQQVDNNPNAWSAANDPVNPNLSNDFNAYLVLEPKLQPLQPDKTNRDSVHIFNEHRKLSQDYLRMQMEVTLLMERKHELEKAENRIISNSLEDYWQLKSEKDSLLQLRDNLMKQMTLIKKKQKQKEAAADGDWVLVDQVDDQGN